MESKLIKERLEFAISMLVGLSVTIFLIGLFAIAILTPIIQIVLFLRVGEWYEADGFLAFGVLQLVQDGIQVNIANAMQMRTHFADMNFGWKWEGLEIIAKWFLDFHLTAISICVGIITLWIWAAICDSLFEDGGGQAGVP